MRIDWGGVACIASIVGAWAVVFFAAWIVFRVADVVARWVAA